MFSPQWYGNWTKNDSSPRLMVADDCQNFPYKNWLFVRKGVYSYCTKQPSFDVPEHLITECLVAPGFGQFHGHVNWAPATFVGKLGTEDKSADGDIDLQLLNHEDGEDPTSTVKLFPGTSKFTANGEGVRRILTDDSQSAKEYRRALWLEFSSYETGFITGPSASRSWQDLLSGHYQGRTTIVTGLLNLDCVHDCHTELHPVLALAIRTKDELALGTKEDDSWAIFVRNAGNQGDCSADEHYLNRDTYTFFLPAPPGTSGRFPEVLSPAESFRSNVRGITWSLVPSGDPTENGALLRFSFADDPASCIQIHQGRMIHASGVLHLNWMGIEPPEYCDPTTDFDGANFAPSLSPLQQEKFPACRVESTDQQLTCETASDGVGQSDDFHDGEQQLAQFHEQNHPRLSWANLKATLQGFIGGELGVFPEILLYNKTSQIQINPGVRYAPFQTALFSFEFDGSPGLSRSVRSTDGQNLSVRISDWLYGFKVQVSRQLNLFVESKGGVAFRSASSGFASTPDFEHFQGHDSFFFIGGGIQPRTQARTFGNEISIRVSAGYMYFPGTGEHMVRLTVGPQFQFHRKNQ
jgi:hypothetical protein